MNHTRLPHSQRGATLIVGLIMLTIITLMVTTAFTLSNTNLKAVGNLQFRDEATAAANMAIEQVITAFLTTAPVSQNLSINLNNDGTTMYTVAIVPTCITSSVVAEGSGLGKQGSVELGSGLSVGGSGSNGGYMTVWDIQATVTDSVSGATIVAHQGMRKLLAADCT